MAICLGMALGLAVYLPAQNAHPKGPNTLPITTSSPKARKAFQEGLDHFHIGNVQKARHYFDQAIKRDPEFATAYIYRSWTSRFSQEFVANTRKAYIFVDHISEGEQIMIEINQAAMREDTDQELALAQKLARLYPECPRVRMELASIYVARNEVEPAREQYQLAIELDPDWMGGYLGLGASLLYLEPRNFPKARVFTEKVVELAPDDPWAYIQLGDVFRAQQDLDQAMVAYQKALELDPEDPGAHRKVGHVYTLRGNYEVARANYAKQRMYTDDKIASVNYAAYTYLYDSNYQDAIDFYYEQADNLEELGILHEQMDDAKLSCLDNCAWIALHRGDTSHIREIIPKMEPHSLNIGQQIGTREWRAIMQARILFWKSFLASLEGRYEQAEAWNKDIKNLLSPIHDPTKLYDYYLAEGFLRYRRGQYAKAVKYLEKVGSGEIYPKYLLASACEKAGKPERAQRLMEEIYAFNFNTLGYALVRGEVKAWLDR